MEQQHYDLSARQKIGFVQLEEDSNIRIDLLESAGK